MIFGSAFFLGALFSPYYPFLFAVPKVHGKMVSSKNSATMMIFYAFGEGILVSVVGYMIILIHPLMLFICCWAMMTTNKILLMKIIESLKTFSEIENKLVETEMNELENKDKDRI